jgi:hypothetical protein
MNSTGPNDVARPELAGPIFGKGEVPVYAMLDGASSPTLTKKLHEHAPEHCCLYPGELKPDVMTVAPYLVRLDAGAKFTDWVLTEGWGVHWGVFLQSTADLRSLRDHFREFLKVELPDQRTVRFRYYDPRVLRSFLPACNAAELTMFFGPVQSFVVEGESPETGVKYGFAGQALKPEPFAVKKAPPA